MSPLSLSSFKINKDVKHQSCSWLIKEDLKYFPLCLTWFWVSPSRTTTTGRNTVTRFFFLLLLSVCVAEIEQTKPRLVLLWCQWVWLFKGSLFWVQLCEHWPPWARQNQSALYAHTCMNTNVACCCFIYRASLSLDCNLKRTTTSNRIFVLWSQLCSMANNTPDLCPRQITFMVHLSKGNCKV